MRPESVALPPPAIGEELSLRSRGEQFGVEEFIPEAAIERLGKALLPWGSRFDVSRGGTRGLAPAP